MGYIINKNITLKARFSKVLCNVTYVSDVGTPPAAIQIEKGTALTKSQLPEMSVENYNFLGWYIGENKIEEGYVVQDNITLKAKLSKELCIITYTSDVGTPPKSIQIEKGAILTNVELLAMDVESYNFNGWYIDSQKIESGYVVKSNITLTANLSKIMCTVYYVSSQGTPPTSFDVAYGTSLTNEQL